MYRVLLADDEIHVCQLVRHLIDWEALDAALIGVANNGVEAFECIVSQKPDIVISDIRMSGYHGIDLLEKTRALGMNCRFILISGYRQFEYAQKAIQLGVTDYVVKPLKKQQLEAAMEKAIKEIQQDTSALELPSPYVPTVAGPRRNREELIASIHSGAVSLEQLTQSCLSDVYGIQLQGACVVLAWKFVCYGEAFSEEVLRLLENKAALHLEAQAQEWFRAHFLLRRDDKIFLVCAVDSAEDLPGLDLMLESCQSVISIFHNWKAVLGYSHLAAEEPLSVPLERAAEAAENHLLTAQTAIHSGNHPARGLRDFRRVIDYDACNRLMAAMQILDAEAVRQEIVQACKQLEACPQAAAEAIYSYAAWVIGAMNHALSAFETERTDAERYLNRVSLMQTLRHAVSIGQLRQKVVQEIVKSIESTRDFVQNTEYKPIRQAKQMVAQQYMQQISLQDIAAAVGLNAVYLSMLFKKETGTNFKEYLTNVRIEAAKKLLREGESMVHVADKVGYKDTKYFSKLFTRIVGVKPTEYKKLYH